MSKKFDILLDEEKLEYYKKLEELDELLELFSNFIYYSNPNYYYNETYLSDKILGFSNSIEICINKLKLVRNLQKELQNQRFVYHENLDMMVQLDEIWIVNFTYHSKKRENEVKVNISENPSLHFKNEKKTYVECIISNTKKSKLTSGYLETESYDALKEFVLSELNSYVIDRSMLKHGNSK